MNDVPSKAASEHPDRASTWYFSGQLDRPPSIVDDEDATNEIPSSFVSDVINTFSAYQASCLAQLEIFSISFDPDRSHLQPGAPLEFTGFVTAKRNNHIRYCTVRDWMPGLVLKWTAVSGRREKQEWRFMSRASCMLVDAAHCSARLA